MADAKTCSITGCDKPARGRGWCIKHWERWRKHGSPYRTSQTPKGEPLKFLEMAVGYKGDDCLTWPYATTTQGYGRVWWNGKFYVASRLVCELVHGAPPSLDYHAAHSCGRGHLGCVNPKHLRWATAKENCADKPDGWHKTKGERHGLSKLTASDVRAIRSLLDTTSQRAIADEFGVDPTCISQIKRRKIWAWLD